MDARLQSFLAGLSQISREVVSWPGGMNLHQTCFLTGAIAPFNFVTSARAIVFRAGQVLVVEDPMSLHVWPGGRIEAGEAWEDTIVREVLEETGWRIAQWTLLGYRWLHHLEKKPAGYPYLYPDFLQAVFAATAGQFDLGAKETDGYETGASFKPWQVVEGLALSQGERVFLAAARAWLRQHPL